MPSLSPGKRSNKYNRVNEKKHSNVRFQVLVATNAIINRQVILQVILIFRDRDMTWVVVVDTIICSQEDDNCTNSLWIQFCDCSIKDILVSSGCISTDSSVDDVNFSYEVIGKMCTPWSSSRSILEALFHLVLMDKVFNLSFKDNLSTILRRISGGNALAIFRSSDFSCKSRRAFIRLFYYYCY